MRWFWWFILLTGCTHAPLVIKEPVEVKVPVPVACQATLPVEPKWALDGVTGDGIFTLGLAMMQELEQHRQYERELVALLGGCIHPPKPVVSSP